MSDEGALPRRGWQADNHAALSQWLAGLQARSFEVAPVAVFDFDHTCVSGDVGIAAMRQQLEHLEFRLTPEQMAALLPESVNDRRALAGGSSLGDYRADILDAYEALWPAIEARSVEAVRGNAAHQDLRAKLAHLYDQLEATDGIGAQFAYPWLTWWFGGFSSAEVEALSRRAYAVAAAEAHGYLEWRSATAGRAGATRVLIETGVTAQPEVIDLMHALAGAGVRPCVVTASLEDVVRGIAAVSDYPVEGQDVLGMRLAQVDDGTYAPRGADGYPVTNQAGKVACIQVELDRPVLLVAGDSDGDYEMLTSFPETEVRLVFNRNKSGSIAELYRAALDGGTGPMTLLQGRDERVGRCHDDRETIAADW